MANAPPKFTPFKEGEKKEPKKKTSKKSDKKKSTKKSSKGSQKRVGKEETPEAGSNDKDAEIELLKKKVKKYEQELRRSDDTILVQEEEINRLKKKLKEFESGNISAAEKSSESDSGDKKGKKSKRTTKKKKGGTQVNIKNTFPLMHINLREGVQKDVFSDLTFSVTSSSGSGTTAAHSAIVSVRCPKFDKALKEKYGGRKKKAKRKKDLDIKGSQTITVNRMLDFLYHDSLPYLNKLKPISLLHLVILARKFSLGRLIWICENQILDLLSLDNVVPLVKGADTLKDTRIRKFCMDFLLLPENFKEFVLRKDLTSDLGMELFQELVTLNATAAATGGVKSTGKKGGHAVVDLGECPASEIRTDLKELFKNMTYADGNVRIDSENIRFHKAILAASSKPMFDCLTKARLTAGLMEDVSECLELSKEQKFYNKLSAAAFKSLLRFVYYGDTNIEALPACLLIPFVREFGMKNLQELCEKVIQQSVTDSQVVLKIMAVTYLAIMRAREDMRDKLRKECILHIVTHLKEIDFVEIKSMEKEFALDLAVDLLLACQKQYQ